MTKLQDGVFVIEEGHAIDWKAVLEEGRHTVLYVRPVLGFMDIVVALSASMSLPPRGWKMRYLDICARDIGWYYRMVVEPDRAGSL